MDTTDKTILITGGSGTLGRALLKRLKAKKIKVLSRSERTQEDLRDEYSEIEFILGDVNDKACVEAAMEGVDIVIHAAAFKFVNLSEDEVRNCTITNVVGSINVIDAARKEGVEKVIGISTDKAVLPRNAYGATKMLMERLFREANGRVKFSCVRYGNVRESSGSVFKIWKQQVAKGKPITLTDTRTTRFFFEKEEAVELIIYALANMKGGEIFVQKMKSYRMEDLAKGMSTNIEIIGLRPGEKIHETLIADYEGEEYTSEHGLNATDEVVSI